MCVIASKFGCIYPGASRDTPHEYDISLAPDMHAAVLEE